MKNFLCIALSVLSLAYVPGVCLNIFAPEDRYALDYVQGGSLIGTEKRDIYFSTRYKDEYSNPYKSPIFIPSRSSACAVHAGGNAFVYYDRIYDDLIPDYTHKYIWGGFTYGTQNEAVDEMFATLYDMMGTNSLGTTIPGFKSGMQQYASSRNHGITMTQATGSHVNVNMEFLKAKLQEEKVAIIFTNNFSIIPYGDFGERDNHDYMTHYKYEGFHTMLVYGYKDIYYFNEDGSLIQRDTYLYVSTGLVGETRGYLDITHFCIVDDIYIIEVT